MIRRGWRRPRLFSPDEMTMAKKRTKNSDPTPIWIGGFLPDGQHVWVKIDVTGPMTYDDGRPIKRLDQQRWLDKLTAGENVSRFRLVLENIAVKHNAKGGHTLGRSRGSVGSNINDSEA